MQITSQIDDKALNKYSYVATFYSQTFHESIIGLHYDQSGKGSYWIWKGYLQITDSSMLATCLLKSEIKLLQIDQLVSELLLLASLLVQQWSIPTSLKIHYF